MTEANRPHDIMEHVSYDAWDNPLYIKNAMLSDYAPTLRGLCHWHDDLEFVYMEQGYMSFNIDGETLLLDEGEGIFINSRHLHFVYSHDGSDCRMTTILLNPALLSASPLLERKYILALTEDANCSYMLLRQDDDTAPLIDMICSAYETYHRQNDGFEMELEILFYQMWLFLYRIKPTNGQTLAAYRQDLHCLKKILSYIDHHSAERLTMEKISSAGGISQSKCFNLFSRFIGQTPLTCLTLRRLRESQELLATTDLTVGQIAEQVGFSGSSYFSERFRQYYKCSPREYRRTNKGES